jgi:hypothetical protein
MWKVVKAKENARIAIHQFEWTDERTGKNVSGPVMYSFLSTISDLANNETGELACGEQRIAREMGVTRQHVQILMRVAERHSFIVNTGRVLPKYNTRVFEMSPRPFVRLKGLRNGYSDITYPSVEDVQKELGFSRETAMRQFWLLEAYQSLNGNKFLGYCSDEDLFKAAKPYWDAGVIGPRVPLRPEEKRRRFVQVARELERPENMKTLVIGPTAEEQVGAIA